MNNEDKLPKILIIDDDQAVRLLLRQRLENLYEIADTGNPEEALSMALQFKPDCILLDLRMPKFSGFELCQTFAGLSYTQLIPILIVSGEPAAQNWASCQSLGAVGYVEKPVNFNELKTRLATVLNTKQKEHRTEVRVRLKVTLRLKGTDADGKNFEVVTHTENVSASGFRCICEIKLKIDSVVAVFAVTEQEQYVGDARVIWVESDSSTWPVAGFQFVDKPRLWALK